jgi:superfamily II DNA or RNA helicase
VRKSRSKNDAFRKAKEARTKLIRDHYEQLSRHGYKSNDTDLFFVAAQRLAEVEDDAGILARTWLSARSYASDILANATGKRTAARTLSGLFGNGHSGIVFCQRIAAADELCKLFSYQQLKSAALHSKICHDERKLMLQQLSNGRLDVLTTAIALDEGIDVPNIDTGIIISSTQHKRQMIQRSGRVEGQTRRTTCESGYHLRSGNLGRPRCRQEARGIRHIRRRCRRRAGCIQGFQAKLGCRKSA